MPAHLADVITARAGLRRRPRHRRDPGIGQGDAGIVPFVDVSLYVMTPEYGAASQLEKIDMLDFADAVAVNKFERRGAEDARRDVARQLLRNREAFGSSWEDMPVFGTSAARFADDGVTALYHHLRDLLAAEGMAVSEGVLPRVAVRASTIAATVVPPARARYLSEVADTVRAYHARTEQQAETARRRQQLLATSDLLAASGGDGDAEAGVRAVGSLIEDAEALLDPGTRRALESWPSTVAEYGADALVVHRPRP